ncbi:MAG TPA: sulfite exporter TauE/SafE family protein, partial [Stellaceae bacterium]|nr:sulfite exporter TauE/SafE family protein [Stellaceae bacterium]
YGFVIGLGSSLMGISGGSLATMALTVHATPILGAVATSAGIGVPIAIVGTLGYILAGLPHRALLPPLSIGFVSVIGVVAIAPISSWVAPLGARLAHALPKRWLELGFAAYLILVGARFLVSLVG